jgi:hypothetical protein
VNQSTDPAVIELEREWPDWQVWRVVSWTGLSGGIWWCARRWDGTGDVLNERSRERLEDALRAAS